MNDNSAPAGRETNGDDFGTAKTEVDESLDARGLNCPLPILRARKALDKMQPGLVLEVIATDPGTVMDFDAFCKQSGNTLLSQSEENDEFRFLLRKT